MFTIQFRISRNAEARRIFSPATPRFANQQKTGLLGKTGSPTTGQLIFVYIFARGNRIGRDGAAAADGSWL